MPGETMQREEEENNIDKDIELKSEKDDNITRKNKNVDITLALQTQIKAVKECSKEKIRNFYKADVEVKTLGGKSIVYKMWVSDEKPVIRPVKPVEEAKLDIFVCEICGKAYDENKKLLLHARFHNTTKDEDINCPYCPKIFKGRKKLSSHMRYHKEERKNEATQ